MFIKIIIVAYQGLMFKTLRFLIQLRNNEISKQLEMLYIILICSFKKLDFLLIRQHYNALIKMTKPRKNATNCRIYPI